MSSTTQLVDMPTEVLRQILGHFAPSQSKDLEVLDGMKIQDVAGWTRHKSLLQNLRLVCRRFRDLTTPLLFYYLSISVDQSSVDRADKISREPHLASCIRGVIVHTAIAHYQGAETVEQHRAFLAWELSEFLTTLQAQRPEDDMDPAGSIDQGSQQMEIVAMLMNCQKIVRAWGLDNGEFSQWFTGITMLPDGLTSLSEGISSLRRETGEPQRPEEIDMMPYAENASYLEISEAGYEVYRTRMAQVRPYLETGAFANDLVACLARLPHLETLEMDTQRKVAVTRRDVLLSKNLEVLGRFVESGLQGPWKAQDSFRDYHFAPIMATLPVRLYDAGIRLRNLRLKIFPCAPPPPGNVHGDSYQLPDHEACMKSLAAATRTLEHVKIDMYFETDPFWENFADDYVRTVLGSPALRDLELVVTLPQMGEQLLQATASRVGRILSTRSPKALNRLYLTGVGVQEASLATMLAGCPDAWLNGVYLHDGRWAAVVDKVVEARSFDGQRNIRLQEVRGGEMGQILLYDQVTDEEQTEYENMGYEGSEPIVLLMAEDYMCGDETVTKNPFLEHRKNASYFMCRTVMAPA